MTNSFCQLIIDAAESHADKMAMRIIGVEGTEYNYSEMLDAIRGIAFRLEKEGVDFGDRVALIGENHPRWVIAYLGILFRGAVCVPIDPHAEIDTIRNFLDNSEAKMAFIGDDFAETFAKLDRKLPTVLLNGPEQANAADGSDGFDEWTSTQRPKNYDQKPPPAQTDDLAVLIYTSGTTGTPKGVPLTHGNIFYEATGCQEVMHISENEIVLSVLPLFHVFAQVVNLWVIASIGGSVCYVKELAPAELTRAFETKQITLLTGVPRLWYLFHKKIFDGVAAQPKPVQWLFALMLKTNGFLRDAFKINLGHKFFKKVHDGFGGKLNITISAGSRFDEKIARDYHALGFTLIQGYGLTETSGAVTATRFEDNVVGSVGVAVNHAEIKLGELNDEGAGEVLIKGKMVFSGYYKNPEATKEAFTDDGWFRSGDLGKLDKNGHLFIVGRLKDVIVLPNGKNIHPEDIETHYLKSPMVEELAILGVKDDTNGRTGAEKLIAVVVPDFEYLKKSNISNSKESIRHSLDSLGRDLPEYQRVRNYIIRVEPLPRTATRKIKRFELTKAIEEGTIEGSASQPKSWELSAKDTSLLETNAAKAVIAAIKQNVKDTDVIHPSMNLEIDLGLDSLARAETFAALEQAISADFDSEEAAQALTVANVIELVNKNGGDTAEAVSLDLNWGNIVREADEDYPEVRTVLKNRPIFDPFAFVVYKIFNLIFRIFLRLEVSGKENLDLDALLQRNSAAKPDSGGDSNKIEGLSGSKAARESLQKPVRQNGRDKQSVGFGPNDAQASAFLICPNHQSFLDPFVLCSNYPYWLFKDIFHVGASEFFTNPVMRFIARMLNVVPVNPDTELMRAMKVGAIGLKHGKILNIYPEGERAFDGELHNFKKGAAILATELDLPIIPVAIDGLHKVWARGSWKIRPAKVRIAIGKPIDPLEIAGDQQTDDAKYEKVTNHLKQTIADMIENMRK